LKLKFIGRIPSGMRGFMGNFYATKLYSLPGIIAEDLFCQVIPCNVLRTCRKSIETQDFASLQTNKFTNNFGSQHDAVAKSGGREFVGYQYNAPTDRVGLCCYLPATNGSVLRTWVNIQILTCHTPPAIRLHAGNRYFEIVNIEH